MNGVESFGRSCLCTWVGALIGCADTWAASVSEPVPFSHYQPILDRMPFGPPPTAATLLTPEQLAQQKSDEQLQAEQQQVAKQIAFTALNVTPRGRTAVGFIDRSVNPPENYYLEVGATAQGWTVLAADYDENWAQFEKDGVTLTMHLHRGLIEGPPSDVVTNGIATTPDAPAAIAAASVPAAIPHAAMMRPSVPGLVRQPASAREGRPSNPLPAVPGSASKPASAKSYLERLRERKAQEKADQNAAEKATRESLQELARKVAQDELAKREKEHAEELEQFRLQQELLQAQQALDAQAQPLEQPPEEMAGQPQETGADPDAETTHEEAPPEAQ